MADAKLSALSAATVLLDTYEVYVNAAGTSKKSTLLTLKSYLGLSGWYNVKANGLVGDGSTDDTAALQTLINAVGVAGGGTIYFPPGVYVIGGALQSTGAENAQLKLPSINATAEAITIEFVGHARPCAQFFTSSTTIPTGANYSIIKSTLTGASGTAAVIAGIAPGGSLWNGVIANFRNLIFQVPSNPTFTVLNLSEEIGSVIENVLIHPGTVDLDNLTQPTHSNSYGIKLPPVNHSARMKVDGVVIFGLYTGLRTGELCDADGITIWGCYRGVEVQFAYHPNKFGFLGIYWCAYGIVPSGVGTTGLGGDDGTAYLEIECLDLEHANGSGAGWQDVVADLYDPTNLLFGTIHWIAIEGGVGNNHEFTQSGGANITLAEIGGAASDVNPPALSIAEIGSVADDIVVAVFSENVKAANYATGVIIKVNSTPATISSATRQATKTTVHYALSAPVNDGDAVTIEYAAIDGFIEDANGNQLANMSATTATNSVGSTTLILDQFTGTNATAIASHTISPTNTPSASWAAGEGSCEIQGNKMRATGGSISSANSNSGVSDGSVSVTVNRSGNSDMAAMFRYVDANNYWLADLQVAGTDGTGTFSIYEKTSGSYTERAHIAKVFTVNTDLVIRVVLNGTSIVATVDGGSSINYTSSVRQTATKHGIWTSLTGGNADFNDFTVTD